MFTIENTSLESAAEKARELLKEYANAAPGDRKRAWREYKQASETWKTMLRAARYI